MAAKAVSGDSVHIHQCRHRVHMFAHGRVSIAARCVESGAGGFAAGGVLALGSIIVLFITGLSEKDGGLGADPSRDVKALLSCVKL